jgi:hypothetical protein
LHAPNPERDPGDVFLFSAGSIWDRMLPEPAAIVLKWLLKAIWLRLPGRMG